LDFYRFMTAILQALGSSGAHIGIGRALLRATLVLEVEAAEIWREARAPVVTRAATAVRTMSFMLIVPLFQLLMFW
jgi:hypothetical protein